MAELLYSPAQLAPILGVSTSTLKRWVDAGHLTGIKTPGGHRKIAVADLQAFLRERGRPVPSLEGLAVLAAHANAPSRKTVTPALLADLLLAGDNQVARSLLLDQFRDGPRLDEILDRLVAPAMVLVGARWAGGNIDVYQEHVVTMRVWSILNELRGLLPAPSDRAPVALGGAPEGDPYLLPCLMAEITLAELGWRTINTGPDTPLDSLAEAIEQHRPKLLWLSITSMQMRPAFSAEYGRLFGVARGAGVAVMLGGQGLTADLQDSLVASAFGRKLAHLRAFATTVTG